MKIPTELKLAVIWVVFIAIIFGGLHSVLNPPVSNEKLSKTVTVFSENGDVLRTYTSVGRVIVSSSGCQFKDSRSGNSVEIQGNFIVE